MYGVAQRKKVSSGKLPVSEGGEREEIKVSDIPWNCKSQWVEKA